MTDATIAQTIMDQLSKTVRECGLNTPVYTENSLRLRVGQRLRWITITLNALDLYDLELTTVSIKDGVTQLASHTDVWVESLNPTVMDLAKRP